MATKRPDGRVEPGQRISSAFSAKAWNRAQDAADVVLGARTGAEAGDAMPATFASNIVLVRNDSGVTVNVCGVIGIAGVEGIVINPSGGLIAGADGDAEQQATNSRAREFFRQPVLKGILPMAGKNFAVALEPIPTGAIGRCASGGVFACRVHIVNADHQYAGPRNNDTTRLVSANCGRLKLLWNETGLSGANDAEGKWAAGMM